VFIFFFFGFSQKMVLLKGVHPLKISQHTQFRGPTLTGASLASTTNVCHFGMVEAMELKKYSVEVTFNGMTSLQNFIKSKKLV
jgi:hypothetical protein